MRGPRRVLMTADSVGGVFSYATDLCRGLSASGIEVCLAVMGGRLSPSQRAEIDDVDGLTLAESDFALEWMEAPWDDVDAAGRWLLALADRFEPELVHLNGYAHARLPWASPVLVVGHSCVASWFEAVKGTAPFGFDRYLREVRAGLAAADRVAAPSRFMADALERHHGPIGDVRVIDNGIWHSEHPPGEADAPFVMAAGRLWDEAKNLGQLAAIADALPWPVKVAGTEAFGGARASLPRGVEGLGRLSRAQTAWQMSRAGVFVHVPRYEPFGLAPLEAAAAGCALVVSDIEPLRTIWRDAAEVVPLDDPEALREAIDGLCRSGPRRAEMALRARERSREYRAARMVAETTRLYRELTGDAVREAG